MIKIIEKYQKMINNFAQRERLPAANIDKVIAFVRAHPANNSGIELANKQLEMRLSIIEHHLKQKDITSAVNTFTASINKYLRETENL